ncbi:MAG: phage baseplate assembly protein V [Ktedonobacteraceae bacterium]
MIEQSPLAMIQDGRLPVGLGGLWYGVYPAIVTDIVDPDGQGRVKVKLPWAVDNGTEEYGAWARLATLMGGNNRGSWFIPDVADEVLLSFEAGDPRRPYVIGALWNGKDTPPQTMDAKGVNNPKVLCSRRSIKITLDDTEGKETLTLETPKGQKVTLRDESPSLTLETTGGQKITLKDEPASVTIETKAGQKITLKDEPASAIIETTSGQKVTLMDEPTSLTLETTVGQKLAMIGEPPSMLLTDSLGSSILFGESGITLSAFGNSILLEEAGITIASPEMVSIEATTVEITSPIVTVEAAVTEFVGIVNTPSLIAESIVSPTYTPGAGNLIGL